MLKKSLLAMAQAAGLKRNLEPEVIQPIKDPPKKKKTQDVPKTTIGHNIHDRLHYIIAKNTKNTCVLMNGQPGVGKTTMVKNVLSQITCSTTTFGPGDFSTTSQINDFRTCVYCSGFARTIVIIDDYQDIDELDTVISILETTERHNKMTQIEPKRNTVIFVGTDNYQSFKKISNFCTVFTLRQPRLEVALKWISDEYTNVPKDIIRNALKETNCQVDIVKQHLASNGSLSKIHTTDHSKTPNRLNSAVIQLRRPNEDLEKFENVYNMFGKSIIHSLTNNFCDNRTKIENMGEYHSLLSDIDLLVDRYAPPLLHHFLKHVPKGRPENIVYHKRKKTKDIHLFKKIATQQRLTSSDLLMTLSFTHPTQFVPVPTTVRDNADMDTKSFRNMNHRIRSYALFKMR
jgi:hypothetical protein